MQILRSAHDLSEYLKDNDCKPGCFADTGFLYGLAYVDDRLFGKANEIHDLIFENEVPIYANVISRMEFVDLILRKQLTNASISLFGELQRDVRNQELFNLLKNIRDRNTEAQRNKESYKINESQLKKLRGLIADAYVGTGWKSFCDTYLGALLVSEWQTVEEELGLNFIEILEGDTSEFFEESLHWSDMVRIMGKNGMRGPDAMIMNLFLKSKFPLLITSDSDFETCLKGSGESTTDKAIFIL